MDLDRGQCFCCNANKILVHEKPEVCEKLFVHLFGKVDFKDVCTTQKMFFIHYKRFFTG